jgi:penicillin-binding protein 2
MLTENSRREKISVIGYIILVGFLIIAVRLYQLQVLQGDALRSMSESNRTRIIGIPAPRGIIYDRNGVALVRNVPYFSAAVVPADFNSRRIPALSVLLGMPAEDIEKKLAEKDRCPMTPVSLKDGLSFAEVSYIEARRSDFPGLFIDVGVSRKYLYGPAGAHLIGYLGETVRQESEGYRRPAHHRGRCPWERDKAAEGGAPGKGQRPCLEHRHGGGGGRGEGF